MEKSLNWFFIRSTAFSRGLEKSILRRRQRAAQKRHRADRLWRAGFADWLEFQEGADRLRAEQDKQYLVAFAQLPDGSSSTARKR